MKTFNARQEVLKLNKPFATIKDGYEIQFRPHLLGSMVLVTSKLRDEICGDYLFCDCPIDFVLALGTAAKKLNGKGF